MKKIISLIIFLVIVSMVTFFIYSKDNYSFRPNELPYDMIPYETVDISFQFDKQDIFSVEYEHKSETLFEITQNISQKQGWDFYFEDYGDMGILLTQIKDKKNGKNQQYWQYFVEGEQPQVSLDKYTPLDGEHIVWKFIESEF